ncbi:hypothetical protein RclHR1_02370005 [Rhizophagus clarus]|uniref:Uncharacterized protein n=1 Tax=Rhizophagus clarus TaxID=94130 RepID=A0A2Z6QY54_9GLOM|nr:hypothetical protein RclHR1_02370005 [Rhizophagus clarus]GES78464.1 hypothetical protein GLOIN_2v1589064 [Rhizophagus clarus]
MNSQVQISNSEINQPNQPQFNPQGCVVQTHERQESSTVLNDATYVVQTSNLVPSSQLQPTVTNVYVQPDSSANLQNQPVHPTTFFYRPPSDFYHYYVICKEISKDSVGDLLNKLLRESNVQPNENECIFYYQQQYDNRLYQVSCEIVSPLVINNCLNKNFLGVEFQQNMEQEKLVFTFNQKEYLEGHLKKYLSQYVLKIRN